MRISVFGLGYVGSVTAACLAQDGHEVVGVDHNRQKVDMINDGRSPVIEQHMDTLVAQAAAVGRLKATEDGAAALADSEMALICVGTPSRANGSLDLSYVERVCDEIGAALRTSPRRHLIVMRSTILPGTMRGTVIPRLEAASGKRAGADFGLCNNPEFLREGSAVDDYRQPPKTVIGEIDPLSGDRLAQIYAGLDAPLLRAPIEVAEMVKYVDNVWHALKVGFGNEIGVVCKALGIDSHAVMDIFCQDTKLNLSPYYLKPGFAFGGSCLPKDLRALTYLGRSLDLELPLLGSVMPSNRAHIERGLKLVMDKGSRNVGVLGFSFKAGTDDLRESPIVELAETLIGKGYDLRLYDRNVSLARLTGANKDFIGERIPHLCKLMVDDIDDLLAHAETVVIGNADAEFTSVPARLRADQVLVDLIRIKEGNGGNGHYDGIAW